MLVSGCFVAIEPETYFSRDNRWVFNLSSCIILVMWLNLMLLVGRFPRLGCYSLMFTTVARNFLKVSVGAGRRVSRILS